MTIHEIRKFDEHGIRIKYYNDYKLNEGIIRLGVEKTNFYVDRAKRLYIYDGTDRIILLSSLEKKKYLINLADEIMKKSLKEWRRGFNDPLVIIEEFEYDDNIEIIDSESKNDNQIVSIFQIDLVSNIYFTADYYFSKIKQESDKIPQILARILAGLYPKEYNHVFEGIPHYEPKNVLHMLIELNSDRALKEYFEFFYKYFIEKQWNIEKFLKRLETLIKIKTIIHSGLDDLRQVLLLIHKSLSVTSLNDIINLSNDIDNYFQTISNPEKYTVKLFNTLQDMFNLLQQFKKMDNSYEKLYYLEESRKKIREAESLVERNFVEPFKQLYLTAFKKWTDLTSEETTTILNTVNLISKLKTRKAIWKEELTVAISVKNEGMNPAKEVEITIQNSPEYTIKDNNQIILDSIQQNKELTTEFTISPKKENYINLTYRIRCGDITIEKSEILVFVQHEQFTEIENPYNFTNPAREEMFFDREELFSWIEGNMKGSGIYQNILLRGQRRTGKTSFLKELEKKSDDTTVYIFFDFELYPGLTDDEFLFEIAQKLHQYVTNHNAPPDYFEFIKKSYLAFGNYFRTIVSQFSGKIILILDEFDKVEMKMQENLFKPGFLLFLRGFLQHTANFSAIVSGNFDFNTLSTHWQEFFSIFSSKRIGALDEDSATQLITKPVKDTLVYDHYAVQKILEYSGGNPYFIQLICHTIIRYINETKKEYLVEAEDVNVVIFEKASQKAEATLQLTWNELSNSEKNILYALSCMRINLGRYIELKELEENLKQHEIVIKRWELISLLGSLREKDVVLKLGDHPPFFDLKIFLLGEWVKEYGKFHR
jgi:hypothetical protein